jgi:hypothetical protein
MKELKIVLWVCAVSCLLGFAFGALPWKAILGYSHLPLILLPRICSVYAWLPLD